MGMLWGTAAEKATTAVGLFVALAIGAVFGTATAPHRDLMLTMFIVVEFGVTYVQRFGPRFVGYGFMCWMGYFFAAFSGTSFATLPTLMVYAALALVWMLFLSVTVLHPRSDRVLRRTLAAFAARARGVAAAATELLDGGDGARWGRRLQQRQVRLVEAALIADGQLGDISAYPAGWSGSTLRRWVLDCQLAMDEVAIAATTLAAERNSSELPTKAAQVTKLLAAGDNAAAAASAAELLDVVAHEHGASAQSRPAHHLAVAALDYGDAIARWTFPTNAVHEQHDFEPAVTLVMGNLTGSGKVARDVQPRRRRWNLFTRSDFMTRRAIQVAVAGALAVVAGRALSPERYYWAVIAAFVMFVGTATRSETVTKGAHRVAGTLGGLVVAIALANITAGNTAAILVVILAALFCSYYLSAIAYAYMQFFLLIAVSQLYSYLHEFTDHLLMLRLEETAIGAAIGIAVALVCLPVHDSDTGRVARAEYYDALHHLLVGAAEQLDAPGTAVDLDARSRYSTAACTSSTRSSRRRLARYGSAVTRPRCGTVSRCCRRVPRTHGPCRPRCANARPIPDRPLSRKHVGTWPLPRPRSHAETQTTSCRPVISTRPPRHWTSRPRARWIPSNAK